jgi:hypothetical protein
MDSVGTLDHNYQYDGTANYTWVRSTSNSKSVTMANIFKASSQETLQEVSVANWLPGTTYSIQIYENVDSSRNNPENGDPVFSKPITGTFTTAGYFTVPLTKSIRLEKNALFSVVVTLKNSAGAVFLVAASDNWGWVTMVNQAKKGESFLYVDDRNSWKDVSQSDQENARIKGLTADAKTATLEKITIVKAPSKTNYYKGESFESDGMIVRAHYSDGSVASVGSKCVISAEKLKVGTQSVEISYTEQGVTKTVSQPISVVYAPGSVKLSATSYVYNGKVRRPLVTVKDKKGNTLEEGKDYKVVYLGSRRDTGKYQVNVIFMGNYRGSVTRTFSIIPKKTRILKMVAGRKTFKVRWKKVDVQTTGYQLQVSATDTFKSYRNYKIANSSQLRQVVEKLASGKTYYVRVRTYRENVVNGKTVRVYSYWSAVQSVITR